MTSPNRREFLRDAAASLGLCSVAGVIDGKPARAAEADLYDHDLTPYWPRCVHHAWRVKEPAMLVFPNFGPDCGVLVADFLLESRQYEALPVVQKGRCETAGVFGRVVAPDAVIKAFYDKYADVMKAHDNEIHVVAPRDGGEVTVRLRGVVLTEVGASVTSNGMTVVDTMQFMSCGMPMAGSVPLTYFGDTLEGVKLIV